VSKAAYVGTEVLARVRNRYARASLWLQVAFGLRRKEALMIQPVWADRGNRIVLHDTWTKGGRPREIPLTKAVAGQGSLIPPSLSYKGYRDGLWQARAGALGSPGRGGSSAWCRNTCGWRKKGRIGRQDDGLSFGGGRRRVPYVKAVACPVRGGPKRNEMTRSNPNSACVPSSTRPRSGPTVTCLSPSSPTSWYGPSAGV